ncbi:MAG TPA: energy transducer TonB [Rhodocyclaceae bacterium]
MSPSHREIGRDPFAPTGSWRVGAATVLHVAAIAVVVGFASTPEVRTATHDLVVRLIQADAPVPQKPLPPVVPVQPKTARAPTPPPPVMTTAAETAAPSFAVAPQPPAPKTDAAPVAVSLPVTSARFDAAYLNNPKPVYPMFSRRNGEEGKVLLRVRVAASGAALDVEVRQSSGFARLDAAARDAVLRWRFVPAMRGSEAVESWVGVPIVFSLES